MSNEQKPESINEEQDFARFLRGEHALSKAYAKESTSSQPSQELDHAILVKARQQALLNGNQQENTLSTQKAGSTGHKKGAWPSYSWLSAAASIMLVVLLFQYAEQEDIHGISQSSPELSSVGQLMPEAEMLEEKELAFAKAKPKLESKKQFAQAKHPSTVSAKRMILAKSAKRQAIDTSSTELVESRNVDGDMSSAALEDMEISSMETTALEPLLEVSVHKVKAKASPAQRAKVSEQVSLARCISTEFQQYYRQQRQAHLWLHNALVAAFPEKKQQAQQELQEQQQALDEQKLLVDALAQLEPASLQTQRVYEQWLPNMGDSLKNKLCNYSQSACLAAKRYQSSREERLKLSGLAKSAVVNSEELKAEGQTDAYLNKKRQLMQSPSYQSLSNNKSQALCLGFN